MAESSDMKILGSFHRLIDAAKFDANYKPTNPILQINYLELKYTPALAAAHEVDVKIAPYKTAVKERQIAYANLPLLIRRSRRVLNTSGVTNEVFTNANAVANKILGIKKARESNANTDTPESEATKSYSTSQMSYDSQLGNLRLYIEILKNEPLYNPNEEELKTNSITTLADDLYAKNNAVSINFVPLNNARAERDALLYTNTDSLAKIGTMAKEYIRGVIGTKSALYNAVKNLKFENKKG